MTIRVEYITKRFGDFHALDNVSLSIRPGELVALLGPSGSGKTTLLRIIAGLEFADSGMVKLENENAAHTSPRDRNVGFVFQHYALFKHMTVFENVAFGLRVRPRKLRPKEEQIRHKVLALLKMVHLEGLHSRYPAKLSGGQRQRVALARALAVEPRILLLDEPFGALDAKVRKELRRWLRRLHEELHITSIFVTHDQEEAMELADRVVIMSNGRIEQIGTPQEVWNAPANGFVYDFLGNYNTFDGYRDTAGEIHLRHGIRQSDTEHAERENGDVTPLLEEGFLEHYPFLRRFLPSAKGKASPVAQKITPQYSEGEPVKLFARPHEMEVRRDMNGGEYIAARLTHINPAGPLVKLEMEDVGGLALQADIPAEEMQALGVARGDTLYIRPRQYKLYDSL